MSGQAVSAVLLPTLGATALVLGAAYGIATASYNKERAALELARVERALEVAEGEDTRIARAMATLDFVIANPSAPGRGDPLPRFMSYALGRPAHPAEVASWDIDIRPDGQGLPKGSGDVWTGEEVYVAQCAHCHGDFGEAVGRWPVLAGGQDTLADEHPVKTIGSYWPHLSTVYDYINRAMPFGYSQSLTDDEVYAITAYLLYLNDLVDDDFELSHENFTQVALPNEANFYLDDRAETEFSVFTGEPCMTDCRAPVEISMRAAVIDVTPDEAGVVEVAPTQAPLPTTDDDARLEPQGGATLRQASAEPDPLDALLALEGDIAYGEYLASECTACHMATATTSEIPSIVGVGRESVAINLWSYREGTRSHEVMQMIAGRLGDEEIAALAAYFASLE